MIDLKRDGAVYILRMDDVENRIGTAFLDEFDAALEQIEADREPASLVSIGNDRFWSNGLDTRALRELSSGEVLAFIDRFQALLARVMALPVISLAAISGHAFGAGALLTLAHDFRVARTDRGWWCFPEVDVRTSRPFSEGMLALARARLSPGILDEAVLTGRRYAGADLVTAGIAAASCAPETLLSDALERARSLADKDRSILVAQKRALHGATLAALMRPAYPGER